MTKNRKYFIALIITLAVLRMIYIQLVPIVPQEAYYWKYAKHLDLSYFDHPPMAAYTIALFTWIGGDSSFFIRIGSVIYALGTMMLLYRITERLFKNSAPLHVILCMACTILFSMGATVMTPDVPFIFFWTLIVYFLVILRITQQARYWYFSGAALGFALLSKYTAVLIVPGILFYLLFSRQNRKWLRSAHPYLSVGLAILIFSPVILWNAQNEWASFLFQSSRRVHEMKPLRLDYFFQLLASQLWMLTPFVFTLICIGIYQVGRIGFKKKNDDYFFLFWISAPVLCLFVLSSFRSLVKMNWLAPAYITLLIGSVSWLYTEQTRLTTALHKWFAPGLIIGLILVLFTHLLPLFPLFPIRKGDTWTGWNELAGRVEQMKKEMGENTFIFGHEYKIPSQITYYTSPHMDTHSAEIIGKNGLQYRYWTQIDTLVHQNAIFVTSDAQRFKHIGILERHFMHVEKTDSLAIVHYGRPFRIFYFYKCYDYQGVL
jgi:hypothetical protein